MEVSLGRVVGTKIKFGSSLPQTNEEGKFIGWLDGDIFVLIDNNKNVIDYYVFSEKENTFEKLAHSGGVLWEGDISLNDVNNNKENIKTIMNLLQYAFEQKGYELIRITCFIEDPVYYYDDVDIFYNTLLNFGGSIIPNVYNSLGLVRFECTENTINVEVNVEDGRYVDIEVKYDSNTKSFTIKSDDGFTFKIKRIIGIK